MRVVRVGGTVEVLGDAAARGLDVDGVVGLGAFGTPLLDTAVGAAEERGTAGSANKEHGMRGPF